MILKRTASDLVVIKPTAMMSSCISGRLSSGKVYVIMPRLGPNSYETDSVKCIFKCYKSYSLAVRVYLLFIMLCFI